MNILKIDAKNKNKRKRSQFGYVCADNPHFPVLAYVSFPLCCLFFLSLVYLFDRQSGTERERQTETLANHWLPCQMVPVVRNRLGLPCAWQGLKYLGHPLLPSPRAGAKVEQPRFELAHRRICCHKQQLNPLSHKTAPDTISL